MKWAQERRFCVFVHEVNLSTIANGCYLLSDCKHIKEKYFMTQSCLIKRLFCRQNTRKLYWLIKMSSETSKLMIHGKDRNSLKSFELAHKTISDIWNERKRRRLEGNDGAWWRLDANERAGEVEGRKDKEKINKLLSDLKQTDNKRMNLSFVCRSKL